jgi:hypothetical protein
VEIMYRSHQFVQIAVKIPHTNAKWQNVRAEYDYR